MIFLICVLGIHWQKTHIIRFQRTSITLYYSHSTNICHKINGWLLMTSLCGWCCLRLHSESDSPLSHRSGLCCGDSNWKANGNNPIRSPRRRLMTTSVSQSSIALHSNKRCCEWRQRKTSASNIFKIAPASDIFFNIFSLFYIPVFMVFQFSFQLFREHWRRELKERNPLFRNNKKVTSYRKRSEKRKKIENNWKTIHIILYLIKISRAAYIFMHVGGWLEARQTLPDRSALQKQKINSE